MNPEHAAAAGAEGSGYTIVENASLQGRNTFRVAARANLLIDVRKPQALDELIGYGALKSGEVFVLGEGSNVLFTRDWPGVVVSIAALGIQVSEDDGDVALVRVEAGENWNDFVRWSLAKGFVGLENLVLIPGSVGAAPIQNIGAYGAEVREFVHAVEAFDRNARKRVRLTNADCGFGYRDSVFKREPGRYIITAVEFRLSHRRELRLDYHGVTDELAAIGATDPNARQVAEAIARIRTRKLPNPALIGNAGSFFKNVFVSPDTAATLRRGYPNLPTFAASDKRVKIPAAWLIEALNFKGLREGDAGVSNQHALVLVNHGSASGAQIWALAQRIQTAVERAFGVRLEPEPIVI